ncbi:MAG: hypothetical protein AB7L66_09355 [Gemmatimonadales bacterium]
MTRTRDGGERRFWWRLAAATGLYLAFDGLADIAIGIAPMRFASTEWRFGAVGLVANRAGTLAFAILLLGGAGLRLGSRAWCRVLAVVTVLMAIAVAATIPLFLLDAIQLWPGVSSAARRPMAFASVRALVLLVLLVGYCGWFAFTLLRASRGSGAIAPTDMVMVGGGPGGEGKT